MLPGETDEEGLPQKFFQPSATGRLYVHGRLVVTDANASRGASRRDVRRDVRVRRVPNTPHHDDPAPLPARADPHLPPMANWNNPAAKLLDAASPYGERMGHAVRNLLDR